MPLWTFVTLGCWDAVHAEGHGLEFLIVGTAHSEAHLESLAMTAHNHAGSESQQLDVGHTVPIGQPWVEGSTCDHMLVSPPYPFGPELESCAWSSGHARIMWLLPITKAERDFKVNQGLEALESLLEEVTVEYWDPFRSSVV
jgi:Suppressor of fused protein (SUFU)